MSQLHLELVPALQPLDMSLTATLKNMSIKVLSVKALYKQDNISPQRVNSALNAFIENLKKGINE